MVEAARRALGLAASDHIAAGPAGVAGNFSFVWNGVRIMATATVTVDVDDAPLELEDDAATTSPNTPVVIDVLANDTCPLGMPLRITSVQSPTTLGGRAEITADGKIQYTPPTNGYGLKDTFTYDVERES